MKAELTNENRLIFESLYIGQDVFRTSHEAKDSGVLTPRLLSRPESKYDWLSLKSISSISDEDAIEVAKIYGLNEFSIRLKSQHGIKDFGSKYGELTLFNDLSFGGGSSSSFDTDYFAKNMVFDFLRSRGYALPWMGLSVDELEAAGWIKLTES